MSLRVAMRGLNLDARIHQVTMTEASVLTVIVRDLINALLNSSDQTEREVARLGQELTSLRSLVSQMNVEKHRMESELDTLRIEVLHHKQFFEPPALPTHEGKQTPVVKRRPKKEDET